MELEAMQDAGGGDEPNMKSEEPGRLHGRCAWKDLAGMTRALDGQQWEPLAAWGSCGADGAPVGTGNGGAVVDRWFGHGEPAWWR